MNIKNMAESYSLHLSETEEKTFDVIFSNIIIEIQLEGEPFNSSIENLKNISSLSDDVINNIVSFLKSLCDEDEEYIFKEILDIIRDEVKIDYTYLTEPVITPTKTEIDVNVVDLTKFASLPPQPYPSWVLSDDTSKWIPPKAYPDGTGEGYNKLYRWNEDMLTWQDILV